MTSIYKASAINVNNTTSTYKHSTQHPQPLSRTKNQAAMTFTPKTPAFEKAVKDSRNLKAKPDNDELLELYSLFKQGSQDPSFAEATKPGMFDLT
ncbi:MAG: hypothetical protein L6R42_009096, partial [Xanthoria sp. 1 TBL-2021]